MSKRKKGKTRRKETRRRRVTRMIVLCIAAYIMCFFPASHWARTPQIPMCMAAVFTILTTAKSKSVKVGFWKGLAFGLLTGMGIWGGMDYYAEQRTDYLTTHIIHYEQYVLDFEEARADALKKAEEQDAPDERIEQIKTAKPVPEEPPTPESRADAQVEIDDLTQWREKMPYYTVPPTIVACSCIGLFFGVRGQQRRKKIEHEWHTI